MANYSCNKCGNTENFFTEQKNMHHGLYCGNCGKFIKWMGKDELRLFEHNNKSKEN